MIRDFYKVIVLVISILFISTNLMAVPAYPKPVEYKLPDGKTITIVIRGDEKIRWAETMDGYSILRNKDGFFEYAVMDQNQDLVPSGIRAFNPKERGSSENVFVKDIPKGLRYSKSQVSILKQIWDIKSNEASKAFPTTGNRKLICILIGYTDLAFTKTQADFNNLYNQVNYSADGATGSVKDYYLENSYDQFNLTVDVAGPYTASNTMAYYGTNTPSDDYRVRELVSEAINLADPDVDFANYDNDDDNWVDGVYIIYAGYGEEAGASSNAIWAHAWALSSAVLKDGVYLQRYSCSAELRGTTGSNITRIGVICHEFGHVLGAPDYYDTDYSTGGQFSGTDDWDMMAGGSWNNNGATPAHHNGFTKVYYYEWATATELNDGASVTLLNASENSNSFYFFNTTTTGEFFFIENREKHLFDGYIPGSGMIIYHVHKDVFSAGASNNINDTHPQMMYPVAQNATGEPTSTPSSYGTISTATCAWDGSGKTEFSDASLPSSKSWAGANTNKPITNISRNSVAKTISFDFMGGAAGNPTGFSATAESSSQINLAWTKNEGNDVLLAYTTDGTFGTPEEGINYAAGESIEGGGTVIYAGGNESFSHTDLDANTLYYYKIFSKLSVTPTWSTGAITTASTLCGTVNLPFAENFDQSTFPACWTTHDIDVTDVWIVSNTSYSGGSVYEMRAKWADVDPATSRLVTPPINTIGLMQLNLSFKHFFDAWGAGMTILIQSSADGLTWTNESWITASGSVNIGPATVNTTIDNNLNIESTYVAFVVTGNLYQFDYWYIDDVSITGVPIPAYTVELISQPEDIGNTFVGAGEYEDGETVNISTTEVEGFVFDGWSGEAEDVLLLVNANALETSFVMPERDVTFYANYIKILNLEGLTADSKTYDGSSDASISDFGSFSGLLNPEDDVTLETDLAAATFDDELVGTDKTVIVSGLYLSGADANLYTISDQVTTASITPKELTVINAAADKVYDGTNEAIITGAELSGVIGDDDVTLTNHLNGTFGQVDVGTDLPVSTSMEIIGDDISNYSLTQPAILAEISPKDLTITANDITKAQGDTYTFDEYDFSVDGLIEPDIMSSVTLTSDGAEAGAVVGTYDIIPSDAVGEGLDNYNILYINGTLTVTDKIELTLPEIIASNKEYDGTIAAEILTWGTLSGIQNDDDVLLVTDDYIANFSSAEIGNSKKVVVLNLSLTGADADSYFIGKQNTTANITQKTLNVTGSFTANNKVYDGTTSATIFSNELILNGIVGDEDVALVPVIIFESENVGTDLAVNLSDASSLEGDDSQNYTLSFAGSPETTASITAKDINVINAVAQDKQYDGTDAATVTGAELSGKITGDDVVLVDSGYGTFAQSTVGSSISVSTNMLIEGADANNYTLNQPTGLMADISAIEVTIGGGFMAFDKEYDGTSTTTIENNNLEVMGVIPDDNVTLIDIIVDFEQVDPGIGLSISITSAQLSGEDAENYTLSLVGAPTAVGVINTKDLTISGSFTVLDKIFDGTNTATINENNLTLEGVIGDDEVLLDNVEAQFAQSEVGNDIVVSIVSAFLAGTDSWKYGIDFTGAPTTTADITEVPVTYLVFFNVVGLNGSLVATVDGNPIASGQLIEEGKDILFTASPDEGYQVKEWKVNFEVATDETSTEYTLVNLQSEVNVSVEFEEIAPETYNLTLTVNPENTGSVSGAGNYQAEERISITATPNEGYVFVNWKLEDEVISTDASFTYTMPAMDITLIANFEEETVIETYILTIVSNPAEGGTTYGSGEYTAGELVFLAAVPNPDYDFINWSDNEGIEISTSQIFEYTMPSNEVTIFANFEYIAQETYVLTLVASPAEGGTVSGGGEFTEGTVASIMAAPNEGHVFVKWQNTLGTEISTSSIYDFTMPAEDVTLIAVFEQEAPQTYTVTFNVENVSAEPIADATIEIDGIEQSLATDESGNATIDLEDGSYSFIVSAGTGFHVFSGNFTVEGEQITVNIILISVGVDGNLLSNIKVYPNPFTNSFVIENATGVSQIIISNLIGQKILNLKLSGLYRETIHTQDLVKGIYLVQFISQDGKITIRKMVKE